MTVLYPSKSPVYHYPNTPGPYIGAVVFELFLYGIYVVFFFFYVAILLHKRRVHWFPLIIAVTMFGITSADVGYTLNLLFQKLLVQGLLEYEELRPKYILYVINNMIADIFLLYKFYLLWNSKKWMLIGPGVFLAAATGCGFATEGTSASLSRYSWINVGMTVILNLIVTCLSAGRILHVGKFARPMLAAGVPGKLTRCAAAMIESGTLYTLYVSFDLAFRANPTMNIILDGGLIQIVSIMPTLILVQMYLGRASTAGTQYALQEVTGSSYWSEESRRNLALPTDIALNDSTTGFSEGTTAV